MAENETELLGDADGVHHVVLRDLLHDVDALGDLAEDRVHAVQVARVVLAEHHEELAAARILAGVRHRERADFMLVRVAGRLALDLPARTAGADTRIAGGKVARQRIAALHDEVRNHAVELPTVVAAAVRELREVLDRLRSFLLVELGDDLAFVRIESGGLRHGWKLFGRGRRWQGLHERRRADVVQETDLTFWPARLADLPAVLDEEV